MAERGVPAKGTNPVLCANEKGYAHAYPFSFCIPNIEQDLRDELPVKKSVDNAF